jgi:hypothetical protein
LCSHAMNAVFLCERTSSLMNHISFQIFPFLFLIVDVLVKYKVLIYFLICIIFENWKKFRLYMGVFFNLGFGWYLFIMGDLYRMAQKTLITEFERKPRLVHCYVGKFSFGGPTEIFSGFSC